MGKRQKARTGVNRSHCDGGQHPQRSQGGAESKQEPGEDDAGRLVQQSAQGSDFEHIAQQTGRQHVDPMGQADRGGAKGKKRGGTNSRGGGSNKGEPKVQPPPQPQQQQPHGGK